MPPPPLRGTDEFDRSRDTAERPRHCEERKRRSNPERRLSLDCFAPLRCARNDEPFSRRG
jgi:hypothetical protein